MAPASTWSRPYAPPSPAYSSAAPLSSDERDGPGWLGVLLTVAIGLVAFVAVFAGILPFPLFGIVLVVIVRGIFARFDDGA